MRTTRGKATLQVERWGDPELSAAMATALAAEAPVERVTHGFHTYPAGLHADAARDLLALLPDGPVFDPFCGGGTVLVEAMLAGREAGGQDLSPVARLVAGARTRLTDEAARTAFRSAGRRITEAARHASALPPPSVLAQVEPWYDLGTIRELTGLRVGVAAASEDVRPLLWAAYSSILIKVSHRESDTSSRVVPVERPPGTTAILFHKKVRELGRRLEALAGAVPPGTTAPWIREGDARRPWHDVCARAVLTSPPYPAVYDYLPIQALRLHWLDRDADGNAEIGARRGWQEQPERALRRWYDDTNAWMAQLKRSLDPAGAAIIVIGDGLVPSGPIDTRGPTEASARAHGLQVVAGASLARPDEARRTTRWEHAIYLKPRGQEG